MPAPSALTVMTDWVALAQRGDVAAFDHLYDEHVDRVHALCLRMTGDPAEAEALTQDVFVQLWRKIGDYRGDSALATWLHRIAVNVVLQSQRSAGRREARVCPVAEPAGLERGAGVPDPTEYLDLERAIATLPHGARQVLVLHDLEGYTHEEIAHLLGVTTGTTKTQLHRARKLLRERYVHE